MAAAASAFSAVGKPVIAYRYQDARPFSDGAAAVKLDGKWGYIDRNGQWIIPARYEIPEVGSFSSGLAFAGGEFIKKDGTPAFKNTRYENARAFSPKGGSALAAVQVGGRWGYIDLDGSFVIPPKYQDAGDFSDGWDPNAKVAASSSSVAPVKIGGKWGYIDRTGRMLISPRFDYAYCFSDGAAAVFYNGRVGYIDRSGIYAINPKYTRGGPFRNGLAPVCDTAGKWGYVNKKGKEPIPRFLNGAGEFSDGLAPAVASSRWGYIDASGEVVLPSMFDEAQPFSEGLAAVNQDGVWGYIATPHK